MDVRSSVSTNGGDWVLKFGEAWKNQMLSVRQKFEKEIQDVRMPQEYPTDVPIIYVAKESLISVLKYLKEEPGFEYQFLADITATDELLSPNEGFRFEVVYQLFSCTHKWRIRVKVKLRVDEEIPTVISLWKGANWAEREIFDMFGIRFAGHPCLRRILMDHRWVGHPLRKDYPLRGYQIFTDSEEIDSTLLE